MVSKLKETSWHGRSRAERLASVLYPGQTDEKVQAEMKALAANERKRAPAQQALLSDRDRQHVSPLGGKAKPR
jgi:hypothetical protein